MSDALTLQGFTEVREVARGPLIAVYQATEAGRRVTLKVLDMAGIAGPHRHDLEEDLQLFQRVSTHPSIVTLHRWFPASDDLAVMVLRPTNGSLAERVRRDGCLPVTSTVELGIKIGGALATSHRAGLIHRDVRPVTIEYAEGDEPLLGDFAAARLTAASQVTLGGASYSSTHTAPEVLEGEPAKAASDLYSLASSLYLAVTGTSPFRTGTEEAPVAAVLRVLRDPVPPLSGPGIPAGFSELLEAAMAKRPEQRPDLESFVEALQGVAHRLDEKVPPVLLFNTQVLGGARPRASDGGITETATDTMATQSGGVSEQTPPPAVLAAFGHEQDPTGTDAQVPALRCPKGHQVARTGRTQHFCRYCGGPLQARCVNGHDMPASATFCAQCGARVS